jgi:hypothetical protein
MSGHVLTAQGIGPWLQSQVSSASVVVSVADHGERQMERQVSVDTLN